MEHVEVNGTRLAYVDAGPRDGEVVLLSHSLFFDHSMFEPLSALLNEAGYRTVAYDHRGQGESAAASAREELSMDNLTTDAAALIEALGIGPVHAVGNSMGGFITLRLAARHPELVRTVAALGGLKKVGHLGISCAAASVAATHPRSPSPLSAPGSGPAVRVEELCPILESRRRRVAADDEPGTGIFRFGGRRGATPFWIIVLCDQQGRNAGWNDQLIEPPGAK